MKTPFTVSTAVIVIQAILATGCSGTSDTAVSQTAAPSDKEIRAAAERDCPAFLARIPEGAEAAYGFDSHDELEKAKLGRPFRVIAAQINPGTDRVETLRPLDEWRVPVVVDGSARALLTVVLKNGKLRATDFGAAVLSRTLERLENSLAISDETPRSLVRAFALRQDFLSVGTTAESARFYPAEFPKAAIETTDIPTKFSAPPSALTRAQVFEQIRAHRKAAVHE